MKLTFIIDKDTTVKEFIYQKISRNFFGYLKEHNAIYSVDEEVKKSYENVYKGATLTIIFDDEIKEEGFYNDSAIDIIYEDDNYIVVDKPPFLQTIPSKGNPYDSVYNRLLYYFKDTNNSVHIINRLDKDTKGLVFVAKNNFSRAILKSYDKVYIATTDKLMPLNSGVIDLPIKRDGIKTLRVVSPDGEKAITYYNLISNNDNLFSYRIDLKTGRTHQIRVHFSHLGSPLINDKFYGGTIYGDETLGLVCKEISFVNPFTQKMIKLVSKY